MVEEVERLRKENAELRNMLHVSVATTYRALEPIGDLTQDDPPTGFRIN